MKTMKNILFACAILSCAATSVRGMDVCMQTREELSDLYPLRVNWVSVYGIKIIIDTNGLLDLSNQELTPRKLYMILMDIIYSDNAYKVKQLDLSNNQLTFLPPEIGALRDLKSICLYNNKLVFLPLEMGNLANLEAINLSWNKQLIEFPKSLLERIKEGKLVIR